MAVGPARTMGLRAIGSPSTRYASTPPTREIRSQALEEGIQTSGCSGADAVTTGSWAVTPTGPQSPPSLRVRAASWTTGAISGAAITCRTVSGHGPAGRAAWPEGSCE